MWSRLRVVLFLLVLAVASPFLHNGIAVTLGIEEPVFFSLFFVFFFAALIYLMETVFFCLKYKSSRGPKRTRAFNVKRGLSWLLMLAILGLTWAALHDITQGEPDVRLEYAFLAFCAFIFSTFTYFLFREKCK